MSKKSRIKVEVIIRDPIFDRDQEKENSRSAIILEKGEIIIIVALREKGTTRGDIIRIYLERSGVEVVLRTLTGDLTIKMRGMSRGVSQHIRHK